MPDIDFSQLTASLAIALNETQVGFVTKYLDKSYHDRHKKQAERFKVACAGLTLNLNRVRGIVDQLALAGRTKEDYDMVGSLRSRTGTVVTSLGVKASASDALKLVEKADRDLSAIATEAMRYVNTLSSSEGRDLNVETAVINEQIKARALWVELDAAFGQKLEEVAAQLREVAPNEPFAPPELTQFNTAFGGYTTEINLVRPSDPEMTLEKAKETFASIMTRMRETEQTLSSQLSTMADGEGFATFLADMKLKNDVMVQLAEADRWMEVLNRWDAPGRETVKAKIDTARDQVDTVFVERAEGLTPKQVSGLEEAQKQLLAEATAAAQAARTLAQTTQNTFSQEQTVLFQLLVALEQRFATASKAMKGEQRLPVVDMLASARVAVTGLNGCNLDALKAARSLLEQAGAMVADAENIKTVNAGIETTLKNALNLAKAGAKTSNPLSVAFTEAQTEIVEFQKVWKTKAAGAAKTEAEALLAKVTKLNTDNTFIINERAAIKTDLDKATQEMAALNEAFKTMAAGSPAAGLDYSGSLKQELDALTALNNTRTQPEYYQTIRMRLDQLRKNISAKVKDIKDITGMSSQKLLEEGLKATEMFNKAKEELAEESEDGVPDPGKLARAQALYDERMKFLNTKGDLLKEANGQVAAKAKDEQDRETFLAEIKTLESDIGREQKAAGKLDPINAYDDEVQRHLARLKATRDLLGKKPPATTGSAAMSELRFVRDALDRIRARGQKTSKSELGKIVEQWEAEVDKFGKQAAVLMRAVEEFEKVHGEGKPAAPEIQKVLQTVIGQMNAHKFHEPALVLSLPDGTPAERKAAREQALAEVRRLRKVIFEDKVVQQCVLNPFGIGGLGTPAQYRLEEIELNVLRGV